MKRTNPATVREAKLQAELHRIRNTYSFRLGLLITDSIVRRPWMIILFPFTFLKMNVDYFREKKNNERGASISLQRVDNNCLMLITASEEGISASERTISIAKSWLNEQGRKIVVISTNENLTSMTIQGVSLYQIPDPKIHREISTSEWNETCANVVRGAIETHAPLSVIFDGTYPYRGVLNALSISNEQKKIWIYPDNTDKKIISRTKNIFNKKIPQSEFNILDTKITESKREPSNQILVATGYGIHPQRDRINKTVERRLEAESNFCFVFPKNANHGTIPSSIVSNWNKIIGHPDFSNLRAAIICDDYNLAFNCCNYNVPTLCLVNKNTPLDQIKKLNEMSDIGGLFIADNSDKLAINLFLSALLDDSWNNSISRREINSTPLSKWNTLLE